MSEHLAPTTYSGPMPRSRAQLRHEATLANPQLAEKDLREAGAVHNDMPHLMVPGPTRRLTFVRQGETAFSVEVADVVVDASMSPQHLRSAIAFGMDYLEAVFERVPSFEEVVQLLTALCAGKRDRSTRDHGVIVCTALTLAVLTEEGLRLAGGEFAWCSVQELTDLAGETRICTSYGGKRLAS